MAISVLAIIALLIVPALLAGIIILFIKGGPVVRRVMGIFLLLVIIGFFGLFALRLSNGRPVREYLHQDTRFVPSSELPHQSSGFQGSTLHIDKDPIVWREGLEEEFSPDVYSGPEAAAYGLGVQLQETISALPQPPERIVIVEDNDGVDIALLEQLRRGLKVILPDTDIVIATQTPEEEIYIALRLNDIEDRQISIPEMPNGNHSFVSQLLHTGNRGVLRAIVQTEDNKYAKQVDFYNCLWLYDMERFRSSLSGNQWAVIASKETAVTKEQALGQVSEAARRYLVERTGSQRVLQSDLHSYGIITDEYTQRLQGMSGPIWRAAFLLDVSPERVQGLGRSHEIANQHLRKKWTYHVFSLLVMIALISILYLFVNSVTKGYYATRILFISVLAFLLFVVFLLLS